MCVHVTLNNCPIRTYSEVMNAAGSDGVDWQSDAGESTDVDATVPVPEDCVAAAVQVVTVHV